MRKKKIKFYTGKTISYRSNYRSEMVMKSTQNYDAKLQKALEKIYASGAVTVKDFAAPMVSKMISDDLVEPCNVGLIDLNHNIENRVTKLKLTKLGCKRIGRTSIQ